MLIFDQKIKDPSVITYHIKVHGYLFNQIKGVNPGDRKEMLTNYFKFFFVWHPYERLVSAWRNKFNDPEHKNDVLDTKD